MENCFLFGGLAREGSRNQRNFLCPVRLRKIFMREKEESEEKTTELDGLTMRARWARCMAAAMRRGGEVYGQKCWVGM